MLKAFFQFLGLLFIASMMGTMAVFAWPVVLVALMMAFCGFVVWYSSPRNEES